MSIERVREYFKNKGIENRITDCDRRRYKD